MAAPTQEGQQWEDFIIKNYAPSKHTGDGGMRDFGLNGDLNAVVSKYNQQYGANAAFIPGKSNDMVDFGDGRGKVDVRTAGGDLWLDEGTGPGATSARKGPAPLFGTPTVPMFGSTPAPSPALPNAANYRTLNTTPQQPALTANDPNKAREAINAILSQRTN